MVLSKNAEFRVQKEAGWTMANLATVASRGLLTVPAHSGVLWPLLHLLSPPDMKAIVILDIFDILLISSRRQITA